MEYTVLWLFFTRIVAVPHDRAVIFERMAEKYPNVDERCKKNFVYKDQLDRGKTVIPNRIPTKDMDMER